MGASDQRRRLAERAELAATAPRAALEPFFSETATEVLLGLARNAHLQERDLLRLLDRRDLPGEVVREIAAHREAARHYSVRLALVRHPRTPRVVSLPILKFLYLFDLVRVCRTPGVPGDVKVAAEQAILQKIDGLARGERISLARRAPGRVAMAMLATEDQELIRAALGNPQLTEADLLRLLAHENLPATVVEAMADDEKWSSRYYLRLALIRHPQTPFHRVLAFLPHLAVNDLRDICLDRRMPEPVRRYVLAHWARRLGADL